MAYRFKLSEPFDAGVRRIGLQQIDRAIQTLQSADEPGQSIHETRKSLKRIRALLRLARPGLAVEVYTAENACFRDIARSLADARDKQVLLETVNKFELEASGRTKSAFAAARSRLSHTGGDVSGTHHGEITARAVLILTKGRARMAELPISGTGYAMAWDGLERSYRQACRAFELAYQTLDSEAIHEWRKRVQYHWRHMSLLTEAWPELLEARISTAKHLSAMLGEDHDIAVMLASLQAKAAAEPKPAGRAVMAKVILSPHQHKLTESFALERQAALRAMSRNLGQRLFAEAPGAFRDRIATYWVSSAAIGSEGC